MDFFQIVIGRYIVELVGASIRFAFGYIKSKILGIEYISFEKYWNKKQGDNYDKLETEAANRIAGIFIIAFLLIVIVYFTV